MIDFILQNPQVYKHYIDLTYRFHHCQQHGDEDNLAYVEQEIFNLIMPLTRDIHPHLISLVPPETLAKFNIEYEEDGFHIKSWTEIVTNGSDDSDADDSEGGQSDSDQGGDDDSSNNQYLSSNSQSLGDTSREGEDGEAE